MFPRKLQLTRLYKRLLILTTLSLCLGVIFFSDAGETVTARSAPCYQECEDNFAMCTDSCKTSCVAKSTDQACNDCKQSCETSYWNCLSFAVSCNMPSNYSPKCNFYAGQHCPIINGQADCSDSSTHYGYYQICDTIGGNQCVACPNHDYCQGSGGQPAC